MASMLSHETFILATNSFTVPLSGVSSSAAFPTVSHRRLAPNTAP